MGAQPRPRPSAPSACQSFRSGGISTRRAPAASTARRGHGKGPPAPRRVPVAAEAVLLHVEAPGLRIKAKDSARPLHFASVPTFPHGWPHRPQRSAWVRGFALQAADKNPVSTRGTGRASLLDMAPFGLAHVACGDVLSLPVSQRMIHFCPYARRGGSARPQVVGTYIAKAVGGMAKCNPAPAPWGSAVSPNEGRESHGLLLPDLCPASDTPAQAPRDATPLGGR